MARTQNSIRNVLSAMVGQLGGILVNLLARVFFLHYLNQTYLGLNGLFTNVLTMLSLVDASQTEKERLRLEARNQEIDGMFLSLYTDKAKGILTEQRFVKLTAALEQEQESNQKRLHDLAMMQSRADAQESEVRTFIKEIRRYATIEELDEAVLNRLISRILIGEVKKVDGQKVQEVRIVYNFVGEIPEIAA